MTDDGQERTAQDALNAIWNELPEVYEDDFEIVQKAVDELARVRAAVTDLADEYEHGTEYGTSTVLVQVAARLRETLGVDQP